MLIIGLLIWKDLEEENEHNIVRGHATVQAQ